MAHGSLDLRQGKVGLSVCRQLDVLVLFRETMDDDILEEPLGDELLHRSQSVVKAFRLHIYFVGVLVLLHGCSREGRLQCADGLVCDP